MKVAGTASSAHAMHVMGLAPPPTALVAAACAGKMLNGSAPAAASGRLWVVSGLPPARHSTGGAGVDPAAAASGCILALALVRHWSNLAFSLLFGWQGELPILAAKNGEKIGSPFFARRVLAIPHDEKGFG